MEHIKDIKFELNTQNSGKAEFITPIIKGEVLAIIISTKSSTGVNITFEEDNKIVLYNDRQFIGTRYLPIGIEPVFEDGDKIRYSLTNWYLNNKLRINVDSGKFTITKFTIRYKEI